MLANLYALREWLFYDSSGLSGFTRPLASSAHREPTRIKRKRERGENLVPSFEHIFPAPFAPSVRDNFSFITFFQLLRQ